MVSKGQSFPIDGQPVPASAPVPCVECARTAGTWSLRTAQGLAALNVIALWYYVAGGRFATTLLIVCAVISRLGVPVRDGGVLIARYLGLAVTVALLAVALAFNGSTNSLATLSSILAVAVFAVMSGSVIANLAAHRSTSATALHLMFCLSLLMTAWAFILGGTISSEVVQPELPLRTIHFSFISRLFPSKAASYSLSYFVLLPMATAAVSFRSSSKPLAVGWLVLAVICAYMSAAFGRRGPLLATAVAWIFVLGMTTARNSSRRGEGRSALVLGVLAILAIGAVATTYAFQSASRSFLAIPDDPRFALWREGVRVLRGSPWRGGREVFEGVSVYAHNAILDLGLDAGIISAILLAALVFGITGVTLQRLYRGARRVSNMELCLLAILVSHFFAMMTEPFLAKRLAVFLWAAAAYSSLTGKRLQPPVWARVSQDQAVPSGTQR